MTTNLPDRVGMSAGGLWLLRVGCPVLGFGLGFAVGPVLGWATSVVPFLPGWLGLAADIPVPWLVPILTVVGVGVGYWLSEEAKRDAPVLTVDHDSLVAAHRSREQYIQRSRIGSVFTDPKDLVVLDPDGGEIFRAPATDLSRDALATALRRHGHPWRGTHDPHEGEYQRWVDGHPALDEEAHALLRTRRRALESGKRHEAEEVHARLQDHGVVVRDRDKAQQYRLLWRRH